MTEAGPEQRPWAGGLLAVTAVLFWGTLPLALKVVLVDLDPETITWCRFALSAVVTLAVLGARRQLPPVRALGVRAWALLGVATVFLAANYLSYLHGLHRTTPANATVLVQLAPLLLGVGGLVFFGERFTPRQWVGVVVLIAGLAMFFSSELAALVTDAGHYLTGSLLIVLAAVVWAVYGIAQKALQGTLSSQQVLLVVYLGCAVIFAPLADPSAIAALDGVGVACLIYCGFNTVLAYGAFGEALARWDASRVSAVLSTTPLATLALAWIASSLWTVPFERGTATPISLVGAFVVVAGSLLTALGSRPKEPATRSAAGSGE